MAKRGIVITPPLVERKEGFSTGGPIIAPQLFRQYLVYWDEIVLVNFGQQLIDFGIKELPGHNSNIGVAREEGIFRFCDVGVPGKTTWSSEEFTDLYCRAQQEVTQNLNRKFDGHWSIGQSVERLRLPENQSTVQQAVATRLFKALPVPGENIRAERILEFRERRDDELQAFRGAFDDLYLNILSQGDQHLALTRGVESLETKLKNLRQVMEEGEMSPTQMSFKALWQVPLEALTAFSAALSVGIPPGISALIGTVQAGISMNVASEPQPDNLPDKVRDYAYLGQVEQELGGS